MLLISSCLTYHHKLNTSPELFLTSSVYIVHVLPYLSPLFSASIYSHILCINLISRFSLVLFVKLLSLYNEVQTCLLLAVDLSCMLLSHNSSTVVCRLVSYITQPQIFYSDLQTCLIYYLATSLLPCIYYLTASVPLQTCLTYYLTTHFLQQTDVSYIILSLTSLTVDCDLSHVVLNRTTFTVGSRLVSYIT